MIDLQKSDGLEKARTTIGGFFAEQAASLEKSFTLYKGFATHNAGLRDQHTAVAKVFSDRAADQKALHDTMASDHELKADYAKGIASNNLAAETHKSIAAHHDALSKSQEAHAESFKTQIDALKALGAEWGVAKGAGSSLVAGLSLAGTTPALTGNAITDMLNSTTTTLVQKTLEKFDSDPEIQEYMRKKMVEMVAAGLGDKLVPSQVSAVADPARGPRPVIRPGQRDISNPDAPKVDMRFEHLVKVDE